MTGATPVSAMAGAGIRERTPVPLGVSTWVPEEHKRPRDRHRPGGQGGSQADSSSSTNSSADQNASSSDSATPQIIGGPIVGVASTSKAKSIREFGGKNHYNDWQFIYNPGLQGIGLIKTPAQPLTQGMASNLNGQIPGAPTSGVGTNQPGSSTSPLGSSQSQPAQTGPQNAAPPQPQPQPPDQ